MLYLIQLFALLIFVLTCLLHGRAIHPAGEVILGIYTLVNGALIALSWKNSLEKESEHNR